MGKLTVRYPLLSDVDAATTWKYVSTAMTSAAEIALTATATVS
jgi:hypothetical protein